MKQSLLKLPKTRRVYEAALIAAVQAGKEAARRELQQTIDRQERELDWFRRLVVGITVSRTGSPEIVSNAMGLPTTKR